MDIPRSRLTHNALQTESRCLRTLVPPGESAPRCSATSAGAATTLPQARPDRPQGMRRTPRPSPEPEAGLGQQGTRARLQCASQVFDPRGTHHLSEIWAVALKPP